MKKHYRATYSGSVQGVGFRYTAKALADKYNVGGWVMNLFDGGVELEAEGDSEDLNGFFQDLKNEFKGYIKNADLEELPYSGEHKDFRIKFH
jgi:acylphosphatase